MARGTKRNANRLIRSKSGAKGFPRGTSRLSWDLQCVLSFTFKFFPRWNETFNYACIVCKGSFISLWINIIHENFPILCVNCMRKILNDESSLFFYCKYLLYPKYNNCTYRSIPLRTNKTRKEIFSSTCKLWRREIDYECLWRSFIILSRRWKYSWSLFFVQSY